MDTPSPKKTPKNSKLLTPQRVAIKALKKYAGDTLSNNEIFQRVGVSQRSGYRILKAPSCRSTEPHKRRGRPKKISAEALAEADKLLQGSYKNRTLSWEALGELIGVEASARTIHNALQTKCGYCKRRTCRNRWLTANAMEDRLLYAHMREDYSRNDWNRVLFSDQVHFKLESGKNVTMIRKLGERYCEDCMPNFSNMSLHAWAAVGWNYKSPLIFHNGQGEGGSLTQVDYITQILRPHIEPRIGQKSYILLEEGNDSYGNRSIDNPARTYKESIGLHSIKNPPCSPDLNIMENIWRILEQRLKKRTFSNEEALRRGILEEWDGIDQGEINKLVQPIKGRVDEVILRHGKMTQF